jgi:signal transduction histidine kinase
LVEDILELSRLDAGEGASEREPVDLVELTDEMMSDLRPLADGKSVSLQWHRPAENLRVLADKNQMQRLVRNLVDNAIKYTPGGGSVTLKLTSPKDDTLIIQVVDTGIGISPEHQTRVFDRFYRADPSHTIPGTGLGLSIVKEIATIHGGNVRLKSAPGVGTIFTVTLPRFKSSENPLSD